MKTQINPSNFQGEINQKKTVYSNGIQQPLTHYKQKNFVERLSCFSSYDLSDNEMNKFLELQSDYDVSFDKENPKHVQFIYELYQIAFQKPLEDEQYNSPDWKIIGFQGNNPATDFRGGGLQSLRDLIYIFKNTQQKQLKFFSDDKINYDFLMAILSINITFFLKWYYQLSTILEFKKDKDKICSRNSLKNLCIVLKKDPEILIKINQLLVKVMLNKWIDFRIKDSKATLLDMEIVKQSLLKLFTKFTDTYFYSDFSELQYLLLKYMDITNYLRREVFTSECGTFINLE